MIFCNSFLLMLITLFNPVSGNDDYGLKRIPTQSEIEIIQQLAEQIAKDDQKYRTPLFCQTTDEELIEEIQAIGEEKGGVEMYKYILSLNLELSEKKQDSLYALQQKLDFKNHLIFQGWLEEFGFLPEEILGDHHYIQQMLLFHPHVDNGDNNTEKVEAYLKKYADILLPEVKCGRMPAKLFATFHDNMSGKILGEPQLYGTNKRFDHETMQPLPALIEDLKKTNLARAELGLKPLLEGEYELVGKN